MRKLVFTSSPSVTFDGTDQCGVDESAPYPQQWLCHYPHTKALAEQAVLAANGRRGTAHLCPAPASDLGAAGQASGAAADRSARRGRLRQVGTAQTWSTWSTSKMPPRRTCWRPTRLATDSPVAGRAYFISQGEPVRCWDWINAILALAGLPPVQRRISAAAAWRVGAVLEATYRLLRIAREPPMTRFLAAQLATSHYFAIDRARRDFGYRPTISTAEGMRRLGAWLAERSPLHPIIRLDRLGARTASHATRGIMRQRFPGVSVGGRRFSNARGWRMIIGDRWTAPQADRGFRPVVPLVNLRGSS